VTGLRLHAGAGTRTGRSPVPFQEFILKVAQLCNLACDYCFVYTKADQSWRDRPKTMSAEVRSAVVRRIAEHVTEHRIPDIGVVFHGGEPLLLGADDLVSFADAVRQGVPDTTRVQVSVQSNGVQINEAILATLGAGDVRVGISIDGPAYHHDRHRRYADGRGSHAAVDRAIRLLAAPAHRSIYAGLLCVVDLDVDPIDCYESLLAYRPPLVDFLLPHAHWSDPPVRKHPTSYADWLLAVFDRWFEQPERQTRIRLFEELIHLLLGGASRIEQLGLSPVAVVVVESDGAIEQVDSLKSTFDGAAATGLNVLADAFDAALLAPGVRRRHIGVEGLCATCRMCSEHRVCGAGNYVQRYRADSGFDNPSVYCTDLSHLIRQVRQRLETELRRRLGVVR
jgi:uncharacterized protein